MRFSSRQSGATAPLHCQPAAPMASPRPGIAADFTPGPDGRQSGLAADEAKDYPWRGPLVGPKESLMRPVWVALVSLTATAAPAAEPTRTFHGKTLAEWQ